MSRLQEHLDFLDQQNQLAIWYAKHDQEIEQIEYVNQTFADIFELSIEEILKRKRYYLVNPTETPEEVIRQYLQEDREAIEKGYFLRKTILEDSKQSVVLKLKYEHGILGAFKISEVSSGGNKKEVSLKTLDSEFQQLLKKLKPEWTK